MFGFRRHEYSLATVSAMLRKTYEGHLNELYADYDMMTSRRVSGFGDGLSSRRCPYCGTLATLERVKVSGLCEHCGGPL